MRLFGWVEEESNLQPLRDTVLNRTRIPVPPPTLLRNYTRTITK